ncbi:two-component system regulatory protein YycI [Gracilibacillus dipsosauri]|nr:two-component system regulatory protein YycI [Gracilibacillus dipsosauri]
MQWGQIKTLFILCFLILDIFLLRQYIDNQQEELSYNTEETTQEDYLATNLKGLDNIPEEPTKAATLNAKSKEFTEEEISEIDKLPNQKSVIIDDTMIVSHFDSPEAFDLDTTKESIKENIWNDEQYNLEDYVVDEQTNTYIFFQELDDPIYYNLSGVLMIKVNENGEMTHYVQTILEKTEEQPVEELIMPLTVITKLFNNGNISPGSEITEVDLGYHNLLPLPNGEQVLLPTWEIEVDDNTYFYINAVEGHNSNREAHDFVMEMKNLIGESVGTSAIQPLEEDWGQTEINHFINQVLAELMSTREVEEEDDAL